MKRLIVLAVAVLFSLPALAGPDLTLLNARTSPSSNVGVLANFTIFVDLKNIGDAAAASPAVKVPIPAGATYVSSFAAGGSMQCQAHTGYLICTGIAGWSLAAGASATIKVNFKAPAADGPWSITLAADPDGLIDETTDGNNNATLSGTFVNGPRVAVTSSQCSTTAAINSLFYATFILKNVGTLDIRYPGLKLNVFGGSGQRVIVSKVEGRPDLGTTSGSTLPSDPLTSHVLTWTPGASSIPLTPGSSVSVTVYMKAAVAQKVIVKASIDYQAIQDNETPSDNQAQCTVTVQ